MSGAVAEIYTVRKAPLKNINFVKGEKNMAEVIDEQKYEEMI